jgi:hypothetical protein
MTNGFWEFTGGGIGSQSPSEFDVLQFTGPSILNVMDFSTSPASDVVITGVNIRPG